MLDKFITCIVDKDLSVLIISGTPTLAELKEAWRQIQEEYSELVKNEAQAHSNSLEAEVIVLQNRIYRINLAVQALQHIYSSDLVAELKEEFMPFDYNPDKPKQYYKDLQGTVDRTKGLNLQLELKKRELEEWYKEIEATSKPENTRENFDQMLAALTESNGFMVDETKITVAQYARLVNRYTAKLIAEQNAYEKMNQ